MRKVIVETGQLTRGAKIAGRILFAAAALCIAGGGFVGYRRISHFDEFLARKNVTPEQMAAQVGRITHGLEDSQLFLDIGLGLMALGIGCYYFGPRNPAPPPGEKP